MMIRRSILLVFTLFMAACTAAIKPPTGENPAPTDAFGKFNHFEISTLAVPQAIQEREPRSTEWLAENLRAAIEPVVLAWNQGAQGRSSPARTLLISPAVEELKFISTGERIMAGAFAGSSGVILRIRFTEKETGRLVNEAIFYQRANAWGSAYTYGSTDRDMLKRVARLVSAYLTANYSAAVGGSTGAESG